jgi:pimeloyl-ACP methyl ester carboxylesterase
VFASDDCDRATLRQGLVLSHLRERWPHARRPAAWDRQQCPFHELLMTSLDGSYPTLAWDAPGYGDSRPLRVKWPDASDYATALNRLLTHLGIERCILVGHSLGNLIAGRYALEAPARIAALVLICPVIGYGAMKGGPLPPQVAARIEELDRLGPEKFAAKRAWRLLADGSLDPEVLRPVQAAMAAVRRPGYDRAARLLAGGQLIEDASNITLPALVISAWEDRITPPENGHFVFAALKRSSRRPAFRMIKKAGQAVCQEQPAEIARAIAEFVAGGVPATAS